MNITDEFLNQYGACAAGREWVQAQDTRDGVELVRRLISHNLDWANRLIVWMLDRKQRIAYTIFSAGQVITIYEAEYPGDNRPRAAIEAAKAVLKNNTAKNRSAAIYAARAADDTAYGATYAARSADATALAARSADATALAARSAAYNFDDAYAADVADRAVDAACAAACAGKAASAAMKRRIVEYGLEMFEGKEAPK